MSNLPYRFEIEQESGGWVVARYLNIHEGRQQRHVVFVGATAAEARAWLTGHLSGLRVHENGDSE